MEKIVKWSNVVLILFFLAGLIFLGWRNTTSLLQEKPDNLKKINLKNLKTSLHDFNTKFEEQAGKDAFILNPLAKAKYHIFNNAVTRKILPGKEGWLFIWEETAQIDGMKQVLGKEKLSPIEIKKWRVFTDQRNAFLENQGIPYFKIIAPNKASIYPEYLPDNLQATTTNFTDQLLDDLREHTAVKLIDLRAVLKALKSKGQLYYKTDTHWNNIGAFYGAKHIMTALAEEGFPVEPIVFTDFKWKHLDKAGGDAARLMMMQEELRRDYLAFERVDSTELILEQQLNKQYEYLSPFISSCKKGKTPKTILFHDSFATNLRLFLGYHFESLYSFWLWGAFDEGVVLKEKPSIVLDEVVERRLVETQHMNSANLINAYWAERFNDLANLEEVTIPNRFQDLVENLETISVPKDQLLIVALDLDSPISQKIKLGNEEVLVPYDLKIGRNKIYFQLDPNKTISVLSDHKEFPTILNLEARAY